MNSYEKALVRLGRSKPAPSREILVQLSCQGTVKRHPPSPPFEGFDEKSPLVRAHIPNAETKRLSEPQPCAVKEQQ